MGRPPETRSRAIRWRPVTWAMKLVLPRFQVTTREKGGGHGGGSSLSWHENGTSMSGVAEPFRMYNMRFGGQGTPYEQRLAELQNEKSVLDAYVGNISSLNRRCQQAGSRAPRSLLFSRSAKSNSASPGRSCGRESQNQEWITSYQRRSWMAFRRSRRCTT